MQYERYSSWNTDLISSLSGKEDSWSNVDSGQFSILFFFLFWPFFQHVLWGSECQQSQILWLNIEQVRTVFTSSFPYVISHMEVLQWFLEEDVSSVLESVLDVSSVLQWFSEDDVSSVLKQILWIPCTLEK